MKKIRTKLMTTPQVRKYLDKLHRLERRVIEAAILWEAATHRPAAEYMESRADRLSPQKLLEAVQALNKFKGRE